MDKHKNVTRLSDVPMEPLRAPADSSFGGMRQRVGAAVGAQKLGYSLFTVPPGKAAFPFHLHHANEEMIFIIEGEGTLRVGQEVLKVFAGTVIGFPPGPDHPHQLINTSAEHLRYLVVSTMEYPDISEYPDSNKIGAYTVSAREAARGFRGLYPKAQNLDYFDGETGAETERVKKFTR